MDLEQLKAAANNGDARAQNELRILYHHGNGVVQDLMQAAY